MFEVAGKQYGPFNPLYIVEGGQNHNGKLDNAKRLVDRVCDFAHAYKTQIHLPDDEMIKSLMPEKYERIKEHCLSIDDEYLLMEHVKAAGMAYITTCYCDVAYTHLMGLFPDAIKVGSAESDNVYLMNIAITLSEHMDIPIIRSHGMGFPEFGYDNVVDMVCESVYPARPRHFRLNMMHFLHNTKNKWGYSCHTLSPIQPAIAYSLGAYVMEFHVGIGECHDQKVSWQPEQLKAFMVYMQDLNVEHDYYDKQVKEWAQHCYVATEDIAKGQSLNGKLTTKRPGTGGIPANVSIEDMFSRTAIRDIKKDGQITEENSGQKPRTARTSGGTANPPGRRPAKDVETPQETKTIH
jgi:sialic acid synthase SpsE